MLEIANRDLESVISLFGDLGTDIVRRSDARLLHVPRLEAARQPEVNDRRFRAFEIKKCFRRSELHFFRTSEIEMPRQREYS